MSWPRDFSSRLQKTLTEKTFTDIDIIVEDQTFSVHRNILIAASDYFLHMFTGGMLESSQSSITITGVSANAFHCVLKFIYTMCNKERVHEVVNSCDNIEELLNAAELFQLQGLRESLIADISNNINEENMLPVYILGWKYNISIFCIRASKIMSTMMMKVIEEVEFQLLDVDSLRELLTSPYFSTQYENDYCRAVVTWFTFDEAREQYFDEVMTLFCYHKVKDYAGLKWAVVDKMYEERGQVREEAVACGSNRRCPHNSPQPVETIEQLYHLYGDWCFDLSKNTQLINAYSFKYSYFGNQLPDEFKEIEVSEKKKFATLDSQLTFASDIYTIETFYQGPRYAENCLVVCGCYAFKHGGSDGTLAKFSGLPKVRVIVDVHELDLKWNNTVNPRYLHREHVAHDQVRTMWRYPYMLLIGGAEVDMDDAVCFASSLVVKSKGCLICKTELTVRHGSQEYMDIWTPSLDSQRAAHFGYGL